MILMKVDLPAPFAPTRPMTPGSTSTVRSESAVTRPPYVLVSASVAMRLTGHSLGTLRTRQIRMNPEVPLTASQPALSLAGTAVYDRSSATRTRKTGRLPSQRYAVNASGVASTRESWPFWLCGVSKWTIARMFGNRLICFPTSR